MKLAEIYRQIPESTCPLHCGECCGILYPSLAEIAAIKEWCRIHHQEYKDFNMILGLDCPYLAPDKRCEIYPVRPFLCRIMGVSVDIPCPLKKCRTAKLLNSPQSRALYKGIYLHGKEKIRTIRHKKVLRKLIRELDEGLDRSRN